MPNALKLAKAEENESRKTAVTVISMELRRSILSLTNQVRLATIRKSESQPRSQRLRLSLRTLKMMATKKFATGKLT